MSCKWVALNIFNWRISQRKSVSQRKTSKDVCSDENDKKWFFKIKTHKVILFSLLKMTPLCSVACTSGPEYLFLREFKFASSHFLNMLWQNPLYFSTPNRSDKTSYNNTSRKICNYIYTDKDITNLNSLFVTAACKKEHFYFPLWWCQCESITSRSLQQKPSSTVQ